MIRLAIFLSALVFFSIIAVVYFDIFETENLKLNEFGDLVAGVVSAIAVIWLVLSAVTQQRELSAQRKDIEETKRANIIQSEALQAATKIEAIRHLRELQESRQDYLSTLMNNLRAMLKRNLEKQDQHVAYLAWKDDLRKPIFEFYFQILQASDHGYKKSVFYNPTPEIIKPNITHEEAVCASDITGFIEDFDNVLKVLRARANELNVQAQQVEWEGMLGLDHLLILKPVAKRYAECAMEVYSLRNQTVAAEFMRMSIDGTLTDGGTLAMSWRVVSRHSDGTVAERGENALPKEPLGKYVSARGVDEHETSSEGRSVIGFISSVWRRYFER